MPTPNAGRRRTFTVFCQWHPPGDACEPWLLIGVVIHGCLDEQDAANNACLYLIRDRMGQAEPLLVLAGRRRWCVPDVGVFDAEEYDDCITFAGTIVTCRSVDGPYNGLPRVPR